MDESLRDHSADHDNQDPPLAASPAEPEIPVRKDLEMLPINLDVRLKEKRVTLGDLAKCRPDAIIPLGLDLTEEVGLFANDFKVGTGHFIRIGDRVGVQVDSWTIQEEG